MTNKQHLTRENLDVAKNKKHSLLIAAQKQRYKTENK